MSTQWKRIIVLLICVCFLYLWKSQAQQSQTLKFEKGFLAADSVLTVPEGRVWHLRNAFREKTVIHPVTDTHSTESVNSKTRLLVVSTTVDPDTQDHKYSNLSVYQKPVLQLKKEELPLWLHENTTIHISSDDVLQILIEQYQLK